MKGFVVSKGAVDGVDFDLVGARVGGCFGVSEIEFKADTREGVFASLRDRSRGAVPLAMRRKGESVTACDWLNLVK